MGNEIVEQIGERIKLGMKCQGFTQKDLADFLGMHENSLANYISGKRVPDVMVIKRIAEICSVDVAWLIVGKVNSALNSRIKKIFVFIFENRSLKITAQNYRKLLSIILHRENETNLNCVHRIFYFFYFV